MARTVEYRPARDGVPPLELVRSTRRRRTVSAQARDGRIVVQLPAGLSAAEEERLVAKLVAKVSGRSRAAAVGGDAALQARADELADAYLDGVRAAAVRWSSRMQVRYGSCTPATAEIRISDRLAAAPAYVLDAVLVHELAHLQCPHHGAAFRALEARYPEHARARGFLEGWEFAQGRYEPPADPEPAANPEAG